MPRADSSVRRRKSSKSFFFFAWALLSTLAAFSSFRFHNGEFLWLVPLPLVALACLSLLVFLHEAGHLIFGLALRFPVVGIEIGQYPFRMLRVGRFAIRIGKLPWSGRTVLGVSARSFSPWRRFLFIAGGMVFEIAFFAGYYLAVKHLLILKLLGIVLLADQLAVNFIPRHENGRGGNDGALMLEILSRRRAASVYSVF